MIVHEIGKNGYDMYDAIVLKVYDRWYICDEAIFISCGNFKYEYKTSTLKFRFNGSSGYRAFKVNGYKLEIAGHINCLKLEYL